MKIRMGKKSGLSDFKHGIVVEARKAVLRKRKYPASSSSLGKNALPTIS